MPSIPLLELSEARQLADAALQAARQQHLAVTVAVCDAAGRLVVLLRDDAASPVSVDLAPAKARTSALLGMPSGQLEQAVNRGHVALTTMPGYTLLAGGVELRNAGSVVGAIAVSGAPSGEVDEALARAGLAAPAGAAHG